MKCSYLGGFGFVIKTSKGDVALSCDSPNALIATNHVNNIKKTPKNGEFNLGLPCEMEIREILIKGVPSHKDNTVFHFMGDDMTFAHFGDYQPADERKEFKSELSENIDIALIHCHDEFDAKAVDKLLDTLSPRVAIIGCEGQHVASLMTETGAEKAETNEITIKKSDLGGDVEKVWVVCAE